MEVFLSERKMFLVQSMYLVQCLSNNKKYYNIRLMRTFCRVFSQNYIILFENVMTTSDCNKLVSKARISDLLECKVLDELWVTKSHAPTLYFHFPIFSDFPKWASIELRHLWTLRDHLWTSALRSLESEIAAVFRWYTERGKLLIHTWVEHGRQEEKGITMRRPMWSNCCTAVFSKISLSWAEWSFDNFAA